MNDEVSRSLSIATDEIRSATRRAIKQINKQGKEPKKLNLKELVIDGLILLVLIILGLKGLKVDLKGVLDFFKIIK
jgi:hypothetical protein